MERKVSPLSSSARQARAFARTQRFAIASLEKSDVEETVGIAFTRDGSVLLGNDEPVVALPRRATRLWLGTKRCFAVIEGRVRAHHDPADARRWKALHPDSDMKWCLDPDVIVWSCVDRGPHAFLAAEWLLEDTPALANESTLVDRLNRLHAPLLEALIRECTQSEGAGARIVAVDAEGLLLEAGEALHHVALDAFCPSAGDVGQTIQRFVRNLDSAH